MTFLATLPVWAIYASVGAVLAGAGAFLGLLAGRIHPKLRVIFPLVGLLAAKPVTQHLILPVMVEALMNENLPQQIDAVTTLDRITFDGRYEYFYTIADSVAEFDAVTIKAAVKPGACDYWKSRFTDGNTRSVKYNYAHKGKSIDFTLFPTDCV